MFYFDKIDGKNILKSNTISGAEAFFTTRDLCICDKGTEQNFQIFENKKIITNYLKISQKTTTQLFLCLIVSMNSILL